MDDEVISQSYANYYEKSDNLYIKCFSRELIMKR